MSLGNASFSSSQTRCWAPRCPSLTMSPLDKRVCHIHAIRYVVLDERLPLSVVPLRSHARQILERTHPDDAGRTWTQQLLADELGCTRRSIERLMTGDCSPVLRLADAERWSDRFRIHPTELWGDVYWEHTEARMAA